MFPSRLVFFFIYIAIIGSVLGDDSGILDKAADEVCRIEPDDWLCKTRENCPTMNDALYKGILPHICSFQGNKTIYCCPSKKYVSNFNETPESKANRMCLSYSTHAFQIPPVSPEEPPRNRSISDCFIEPLVETIPGGEDAKPKEIPHMALVGYKENQQTNITWICGGSLISPKFVLGAAHCVPDYERFQFWVRLGDIYWSSETAEAINVQVKKIIKHPEYKEPEIYNDLALFKLESEVKFNSYVRPLCLHTSMDIYSSKLLATEWRRKNWESSIMNSTLQKIILPYVPNKECEKSYGIDQKYTPKGIVKDLILCAGGVENKGICRGSTGGPLQVPYVSSCVYKLVGVPYGGKCYGFPTLYTRVSHYLPWIVENVWP